MTGCGSPINWFDDVFSGVMIVVVTYFSITGYKKQLVGGLEHEFYDFPFSWECHHPK